jgi:hypothetical protein
MRTLARLLSLALAAAPLGCGGDGDQPPLDPSGMYSINLRNDMNGCALENWQEGAVSMVPLTITRSTTDPTAITGKLGGVAGVVAVLVIGTDTFTGTIKGANVQLESLGSRRMMMGACESTGVIRLQGMLAGDALTGLVSYSFNTNKDASCGVKNTCATLQSFNGTRPPTKP